jgi:ankyrin repeat protein
MEQSLAGGSDQIPAKPPSRRSQASAALLGGTVLCAGVFAVLLFGPQEPRTDNLFVAAALYPEDVPTLIARGADVNERLKSTLRTPSNGKGDEWCEAMMEQERIGLTPLASAVRARQPKSIKFLFRAGADPNLANNLGETPLYRYIVYTCQHPSRADDELIIRLLLEHGADPNQRSLDGNTPLYWAVFRNRLDIARNLLEHGADANQTLRGGFTTPLALAVEYQQLEVVRLLLQHDTDPNAKYGKHGDTPLHAAVATKNAHIVRLLLDFGANTEGGGRDDEKPLHIACRRNIIPVVKMLIAAGADVEATDHQGNAPLQHAVAGGNYEAAELLLRAGASPTRTNSRGRHPLDQRSYDQRMKELFTAFIESGTSD